jgi:6-phosphogluconolactonase
MEAMMRTDRGLYRSCALSLSLVVGLSVATLAGCSDGSSSTSSKSTVPKVNPSAPQGAVAIAGDFAYAPFTNSHTISGYRIGSTGALTQLPGFPIPSQFHPNSIDIAVKGTRKFAYVANAGSNAIRGYEINTSTGLLTEVPGSPVSAGNEPDFVTVDPLNRFVYAVNFVSNSISAFKIEDGGTLTPVGTTNTGAGPQGMVVDPTGKHAYTVNFAENSVSGYAINQTSGTLTPLPDFPLQTSTGPNAITVTTTSAGTFVYVVSLETNRVSTYSMDSTGKLTSVGTVGTGPGPEGIAIAKNQSGDQFAYVGNGSSDNVSAYRINANGTLTELLPRVQAGNDPEGMAVGTNGSEQFVYALNHASNDVSAYKIEANGALTQVPGSPFPF